MNDQQADRLIAALNSLEEDVERLITAIEHWEVVNTARENAATEASMTVSDAMTSDDTVMVQDEVKTVDDKPELFPQKDAMTRLREHFDRLGVAVELEKVNGKIYVAPQEYMDGNQFQELISKPKAMQYDSDAQKGKQNHIPTDKVGEYIRETA